MSNHYQYIILLLVPFLIAGDKNDWYEMNTMYGSITLSDSGWAKPVQDEREKAVLFEEFLDDTNNKTYIQVMSGKYSGYYLSGSIIRGVGVYQEWNRASYFKWNSCYLENLSLLRQGLQLTYGPNGYFYFSKPTAQYPLICVTKIYPNRNSTKKCNPKAVQGTWRYLFTIPGKTSRTLRSGTTKKFAESRTDEWSKQVTLAAAAGSTFLGFAGGAVGVSGTLRHSVTDAYGKEWSTNIEDSWTVEFSEKDRGKALWQFVFIIKDDCDHEEQALIREYALTPNQRHPPCCLPGYSSDGLNYGICDTVEAVIERNNTRCDVSYERHQVFFTN